MDFLGFSSPGPFLLSSRSLASRCLLASFYILLRALFALLSGMTILVFEIEPMELIDSLLDCDWSNIVRLKPDLCFISVMDLCGNKDGTYGLVNF